MKKHGDKRLYSSLNIQSKPFWGYKLAFLKKPKCTSGFIYFFAKVSLLFTIFHMPSFHTINCKILTWNILWNIFWCHLEKTHDVYKETLVINTIHCCTMLIFKRNTRHFGHWGWKLHFTHSRLGWEALAMGKPFAMDSIGSTYNIDGLQNQWSTKSATVQFPCIFL